MNIFPSAHSPLLHKKKMVWWHGQSKCVSWWFGVSCWWWVIASEELYHLVPCPVLVISLLGSKSLALRDPLQRLLWEAGLGSLGSALQDISAGKNAVGNTFLCQHAASKASVRECCDGIWIWRAFLLSFGSEQQNLALSYHSNVNIQGGARSWWCLSICFCEFKKAEEVF